MKIAHYHKISERDIVEMMLSYNPEGFSKTYISKNYEDYNYPPEIMEDPNASWVGATSSANGITRMERIIEDRPADTSIYSNMLKYYKRNKTTQLTYRTLMEAQHLRLSKNGVKVSPTWETQISQGGKKVYHVIYHDNNITKIAEAAETIRYIGKKYGSKRVSYGFKFPIHITNDNELDLWGHLPKHRLMNDMRLEDMVSDELLESVIIFPQNFKYIINNRYWTIEKFINELPHIFLQGNFLFSRSIPFLLNIEQDFLIDERWYDFIDFLNVYFEEARKYGNKLVFSAFTFCKYCYFNWGKDKKIEMFLFIKEQSPELFDYLYHLEYALFENNKFVPKTYSWKQVFEGGGYGGHDYHQAVKREENKFLNQYSYNAEISENNILK